MHKSHPDPELEASIAAKRTDANAELLPATAITCIAIGALLLVKQAIAPDSPTSGVAWKSLVAAYSLLILIGLTLVLLRRVEDPHSVRLGAAVLCIAAATSLISVADSLVSGDLSGLAIGMIGGAVAFRAGRVFHVVRTMLGLIVIIFGSFAVSGVFPQSGKFIVFIAFAVLSLAVAHVLEGYANRSFRLQAELEAVNLRLRDISLRDKLTGLYNRHFIDETLEKQIDAAGRGIGFSVVMVDIDHFKAVNDELGHSAGDTVIVAIARALGAVTRGNDVVGRFGGEEFLILLPGTDRDGAVVVGRHILETVRALSPGSVPRPVTVSAGIAAYIPGDTAHAILERVDAMMYKAKKAGRDRMEFDKQSVPVRKKS